MRAVLPIVLFIVVLYVIFEMSSPKDRKLARQFLSRHGWRVAAIAVAVFLVLAVSVQLGSAKIF